MAAKLCPRCGNEFDADEAQGLCPPCLLREAARPESERDPVRKALEAKLHSQYRVIRLVGRGGMGAVYLARDLALDREVAIKVVKTAADDRTMYERLRREAKTAAKLSHPNIVPLHAYGEVEGMPYFVMGFVRGESLADRMQRDGRLPEDDARRILGEIADALDHAHRQDIVHRDIKPDNVLLDDETGRALLTDFGVARGIGTGETLTQHGSVIGTPQYMSPEQAAGRSDIDGRSDIYSLGVMGYEMVAGRLPFEGSSAADVLAKHLTQQPPPLRSLAPAVSDSTVQAVERCLSKNPSERWQDARSLKLALGVTEESQLPDALHAVESKGILGLALTLALMLFWLVFFEGPPWARLSIEIWMAFIFVFSCIFVVSRLRREGFPVAQSMIAMWREPSWWLWWYPRPLRRRGNVWERLPGAVKYLRWSMFAFLLFVCAIYFDITITRSFGFGHPKFVSLRTVQYGVFPAIVIAWFYFIIRSRRLLSRAGLDPADVNRVMLTIPPSRTSFWGRMHIAMILAPVTAQTLRRAESPRELMQSIIRDANDISGPLRPLGAQAAIAARQLVESIEQTERQIADLLRNLDSGEEERLVTKIDALTGVEEYAPMRALLQRQLELTREMTSRVDEANEQRNRRMEMLRTLALHVASLRTRIAPVTPEVRAISDEVQALCDEIGRQSEMLGDQATDDLPTVDRAATHSSA